MHHPEPQSPPFILLASWKQLEQITFQIQGLSLSRGLSPLPPLTVAESATTWQQTTLTGNRKENRAHCLRPLWNQQGCAPSPTAAASEPSTLFSSLPGSQEAQEDTLEVLSWMCRTSGARWCGMNWGAFDLCFVAVCTLPHCQGLSGLSHWHVLLPQALPHSWGPCFYSWPPGLQPLSVPGITPPPVGFFCLLNSQNLALRLCFSFCCHSSMPQLLGSMARMWDQPASNPDLKSTILNSKNLWKLKAFLVSLTQTHLVAKLWTDKSLFCSLYLFPT